MKTPGTRGRSEHRDEVHRITNAADSLRQDQSRRAKRYLVQMGIRMACFVGAFFADGWLMWALLAGAVLLPYAAVIGANETRVKGQETEGPLMEYYQLPSAESATGKFGPAAPRPSAATPPPYVYVMDPDAPTGGPERPQPAGPADDVGAGSGGSAGSARTGDSSGTEGTETVGGAGRTASSSDTGETDPPGPKDTKNP